MVQNNMIEVDLKRYEELVKLEERVNIAVDMIVRKGYVPTEEVLFTIGTELAIEKALELHEEAEALEKKYKEKRAKEGLSFSMMLEEV